MTDPVERTSRPHGFDDPTRDIRLPPAPGSPPLVVRPEWSSYAAPSAPEAPPAAPEPGSSGSSPVPGAAESPSAAHPAGPPTRAQRLAGEPTDELFPPGGLQRDPTLKFEQGAGAPQPAPLPPAAPVRARNDGGRRWPWVLIALLPIIVIVGSGIWLFILLSHA